MDTLRGLRPKRGARRSRPRDDGTAGGALRLLYWRFLALAESRGAGWRAIAETPAEHEARVASMTPAWSGSATIVRAFEDLRYGEQDPSPDTLARAREAYRGLETRPRGS